MDGLDAWGLRVTPPAALGARLLAGLWNSMTLVALYDGEDKLRYANQAFRDAFLREAEGDLDFEGVVRLTHAMGTGACIQESSVDDYVARVRQQRRSQPRRAFAIELVDGRRLWLTETLLDDAWLLCEANDVTSLKRAEKSLRISRNRALEASQTDFLTKLPNRRQGHGFLERLLAFSRAGSVHLSVALVDLDHFKQVNDRYGHAAGDLALCDFADALRSNLRASDLVARIGGEEFMVVWPNASAKDAFDSLMRLHVRRVVVETPAADRIPVTFSAGVAQATMADTMQSLLERADRALYVAKARGRDRVEVDGGAAPPRRPEVP
ncbi:MAG: GGDEF domain-containing protein [Candidimonas sp.]|nr:MAG: GGDEF domain-containing protein [Candidimonas sp.]